MTLPAAIPDELLADFVAETRESLEQIAAQLVSWEQSPSDPVHLETVFRFVHTVKGSCGFLDLPRIAALAHAAETVLSEIREGQRTIDRLTTSNLLALIDRIGSLTDAIESGAASLDGPDDAALIAALDAVDEHVAGHDVGQGASVADHLRPENRTVRVGIDRLEALMAQVSDLVLARNDLAHAMPAEDMNSTLGAAFSRLSFVLGEVRETVARTRLQPIQRLFASVPRLVRDTAAMLGKEVRVEIEGGDVEIDREMIEAIRDPLVHVIRNAIDHGIEMPEARRSKGKPAQGVLRVVAVQTGNQVSIRVSDDGRGIDTGQLLAKAIAAQLVDPAEAQKLGVRDILQLIFAPGLSTAEQITQVSGRGVGMDVVRANVVRLGGTIEIDNRPGLGLGLTLRVPLTLSIMSVLVIKCGGLAFALPRAGVEEIVHVGSPSLRLETIGSARIALLRGQMMSAIGLADQLGLQGGEGEHLVVLGMPEGGRFAMVVDRVVDHVDLVVRPVAPQLSDLALYSGQSLSEDGSAVLLLDAVAVASAAGIEGSASNRCEAPALQQQTRAQVLLFVGLDGVRRALPAPAVERISEIPVSMIVQCGGKSFAALGGGIMPVMIDGALPSDGIITALYLVHDGETVVYPVRSVVDLVGIDKLITADDTRQGAGVGLVDGAPVEVVAWPRTHGIARRRKRGLAA